MKKPIILIFVCIYSITYYGQDTIKNRMKEFYLTLANLSPFNLQVKYKQQIGKTTFFKLGIVNLSAFANELDNQDPNKFGSRNFGYSDGIEIGIEYRKQLTKKFSLFHGPSLSFSYQNSVSQSLDPSVPPIMQKNTTQFYSFSIPYSLGLLFNINSNILVAGELNPNINFTQQVYKNGQNPNTNSSTQNIRAGFDNRIALFSIVYRL